MNLDIFSNISELLASALAILFAISIHEFGHAYIAHLNGDDTAKFMGRMTINPIKHLDILGMITMFVVGFGWAKPVPVNPNNYYNEKIGNITVSLAGIMFNIVSAIVFTLVYKYVNIESVRLVSYFLIIYNIGFAAFNILPIPPLDGWSVISTFLPRETVYKFYGYSQYSFIILFVLLSTGSLEFILSPIYNLFYGIVNLFL